MGGSWNVVEAPQGKLTRYAKTILLSHRHHTEGHVVTTRENSRGPLRQFKECTSTFSTARRHKITLHHQRRINRNSCLPQRLAVPFVALVRHAMLERPLYMCN